MDSHFDRDKEEVTEKEKQTPKWVTSAGCVGIWTGECPFHSLFLSLSLSPFHSLFLSLFSLSFPLIYHISLSLSSINKGYFWGVSQRRSLSLFLSLSIYCAKMQNAIWKCPSVEGESDFLLKMLSKRKKNARNSQFENKSQTLWKRKSLKNLNWVGYPRKMEFQFQIQIHNIWDLKNLDVFSQIWFKIFQYISS